MTVLPTLHTERLILRIHANFLLRNPASGRVMEKLDMRHEELQRKHTLKDGTFEPTSLNTRQRHG